MSFDKLAQTVLFHTKYLILTQTPQKAQNMHGAALAFPFGQRPKGSV